MRLGVLEHLLGVASDCVSSLFATLQSLSHDEAS